MASKSAGLNIREWLQPRNLPRTEVAVRIMVFCRAGPETVKADVPWEETGMSTRGSPGVRVQACGERFAEITPGKADFQPGLTATGKDCESERKQRDIEDLGLAHEFV